MPRVISHAHFEACQEDADRYMALLDRNQQAFDLSQRGELHAAEHMYRDILHDKPAAGFDEMSIALTKNALGCILRKLGKLDEAMELLQDALDVRERYEEQSGDSKIEDSWVTRDEIAKVYEAHGDCAMALQTRVPGKRICSSEGCKATGFDKLHGCSRCKCVFYCDKSCQMDDWKRHKPLCKPSTAP
jgi:tetratricopeptide (TPR) repeat protein|uniref:MYND-type domain-containing protein n=1 Tax=Globisporangium ultimum (strain ATCC 200006 / CBS 805.95 / DAOM BR144) TaxID=431595 RepID=K3WX20_GLOUD